MKKQPSPKPAPRPHNDRGQGRKSMSGSGVSPKINIRLPAELVEKVYQLGGSAWVRGLIEAA